MTKHIIIRKSTGKKVKNTPRFDYASQAMTYIENIMGDSQYVTIKRVR